jgi:hypothetical protein
MDAEVDFQVGSIITAPLVLDFGERLLRTHLLIESAGFAGLSRQFGWVFRNPMAEIRMPHE